MSFLIKSDQPSKLDLQGNNAFLNTTAVVKAWSYIFTKVTMIDEENYKSNHRKKKREKDKGLLKKKCQLSCSFDFCWSLLLFLSNMVHRQWLKVWFFTSQMPVLSSWINFVPISTTSNFCFSKIPMKYSKNGEKFAMSKNASNMLFKTCWTPCKKPHFSMRSKSWYTFFWMTHYLSCPPRHKVRI